MSGVTGTIFEELYSSYVAATTTTPAAAATSITAGMPAIIIPANYMGKLGNEASSLRIEMGGQLTMTATIPTWSFGLSFTTTSTFAGTPSLGSTAVFTPGQAATGLYWEAVLNVGLRTIGAPGANSTVVTVGRFISNSFLTAAYSVTGSIFQTLPAANVAPTTATWDIGQQYYFWPYVTLGAATAGNTVSTHFVKVYGEN